MATALRKTRSKYQTAMPRRHRMSGTHKSLMLVRWPMGGEQQFLDFPIVGGDGGGSWVGGWGRGGGSIFS